ncbi:MAG: response regulator [Parcubacteria group bacterium]|jgi:DNA-binding response OmpR family regulator|nr:response regulator [Parcubacteria group bacterium]
MAKKKVKILVVEDEGFLLNLYQARLEQAGYEVIKGSNGAEGFSLASLELPDLILLDVMMPQVDGYEMLQKVKANPKTKKIPVIIFSNLSQKEEVEKGLRLGAKDFIIKTSVTPTELAAKVKEYLKSTK